jgi:hypothetical protein
MNRDGTGDDEEASGTPAERPSHVYTVGADEPQTLAVVAAVAEATGIAACDPPPRYDAVDPDALDGLFERRPDPSVRSRPRSAGSGPGVRGCSR